MRIALRVVKAALVGLVIVTLIVVGVVGELTARGRAQTSGTVHVTGLHAAVDVQRDASGIVQITANDAHDLFLAQGYVHAQERMWQMELSRRIGTGRLSELFGKGQLDTDRYIRTLGWRAAAERDLGALSPDTVAALEAYAAGVNAWIDDHRGRLPAAFAVAGLLAGTGGLGGFELEPWTPLDTATWQKVQAWSLGGNADVEIFRLLADKRLGDHRRTNELFPAYRDSAPVITPRLSLPAGITGRAEPVRRAADPVLSADQASSLAALARAGGRIGSLAGFDAGGGLVGDHGVGSNNWVASGDHTLSGKPILANDPHLGFAMPSIWIVNGLHCRVPSATCPWDVVGVSFPGAPAVIIGHNERIAWGATNVGPDTQDLYLETVDPADPTRYLYRGESRPFDVRRETIRVAGGEDVVIEVRSTHHGPVLSDVEKQLADGPVLSLAWAATKEPDRTLDAIFQVNVAGSFDEFRAALGAFAAPSQNFIYADVDGHIGYVLPGRLPIRAGLEGERVRDGASGDQEWTGWIPSDQLPWQLDPPSGRIVTANNRPVDDDYPYWIGPEAEFDPGYRSARIDALLSGQLAAAPLTVDAVREMQLDSYVLRADETIPGLVALMPSPVTADGQAVLAMIEAWDRTCGVESAGCAAYMALELELQRAIFDDELGPLARDYVGAPPSWVKLIELLDDRGAAWWNDTATPDLDDPGPILVRALDRAGAELRAALGEPSAWRWGRLHRVTFRESTLGGSGIGILEWYFNAATREVSGANGTVNNNYYRFSRAYPDPYDPRYEPVAFDRVFEASNGPSVRFTIDMADLDGAGMTITTGQSGNPFDAHYGDLIDTWVSGGTLTVPFTPSRIAQATTATLTLSPP